MTCTLAPYAKVTSNNVLNHMLRYPDMALTVENFVEFNWMGEKTEADLEGEDFCEISDFLAALEELYNQEGLRP